LFFLSLPLNGTWNIIFFFIVIEQSLNVTRKLTIDLVYSLQDKTRQDYKSSVLTMTTRIVPADQSPILEEAGPCKPSGGKTKLWCIKSGELSRDVFQNDNEDLLTVKEGDDVILRMNISTGFYTYRTQSNVLVHELFRSTCASVIILQQTNELRMRILQDRQLAMWKKNIKDLFTCKLKFHWNFHPFGYDPVPTSCRACTSDSSVFESLDILV
jgi:hypothetical protein